jgi:hypothetical protein
VRVNLHDSPVGPRNLAEWKARLTANVPGSVEHHLIVMAAPSNFRLLIPLLRMPLWDFLPDSTHHIFCSLVIAGDGEQPKSKVFGTISYGRSCSPAAVAINQFPSYVLPVSARLRCVRKRGCCEQQPELRGVPTALPPLCS